MAAAEKRSKKKRCRRRGRPKSLGSNAKAQSAKSDREKPAARGAKVTKKRVN
jgi:hypothetical protein